MVKRILKSGWRCQMNARNCEAKVYGLYSSTDSGPAIGRISLPRGYQIDADDIIPVIQMTPADGAVSVAS
jgi:hypothetical protein